MKNIIAFIFYILSHMVKLFIHMKDFVYKAFAALLKVAFFVFDLLLSAENVIGRICSVINQYIVSKVFLFVRGRFSVLFRFLGGLLKTLFSYVYDLALFYKLRSIFQWIWEVVYFPFFRLAMLSLGVVLIFIYAAMILLIPLYFSFYLPAEEIGNFMIEHQAVSLGRLKELGLVSETKQAAFFYVPNDLMTGDGIPLWREHAMLCFMGYSLKIFGWLALLVSRFFLPKVVMQSIVDFFLHTVFPNYMDKIHTAFIGRYMAFIHNNLFFVIDQRFMIPSYRPDLKIYYKSDMTYYYVLNLDDPFVLQFIPVYCLWVFFVTTLECIPYGLGYVFYFVMLRLVYKLMILFWRDYILPLFSISTIKNDWALMRNRLRNIQNEFKDHRPCFGEFYVLTVAICSSFILYLTLM